MGPFFWLVNEVLFLYEAALFVWVVMSWLLAFNVINGHNRLVYAVNDFLYRITEPALRPIRRFIPMIGGVDLSPMVLILLIHFARLELVDLEYRMMMG
jgi:YggT family protein